MIIWAYTSWLKSLKLLFILFYCLLTSSYNRLHLIHISLNEISIKILVFSSCFHIRKHIYILEIYGYSDNHKGNRVIISTIFTIIFSHLFIYLFWNILLFLVLDWENLTLKSWLLMKYICWWFSDCAASASDSPWKEWWEAKAEEWTHYRESILIFWWDCIGPSPTKG